MPNQISKHQIEFFVGARSPPPLLLRRMLQYSFPCSAPQRRKGLTKNPMRIDDFNDRLKHAVIVADGAMGSLLYESVGPLRSVDELNSSDAEAVFRVHQTYIEAGAQLVETNTFGANRHKLSQIGMADRVAELNHRGVKIARDAREAAKHEVL